MKRNRFRLFNISLLRRMVLLMGCLLFSWSSVVPFYRYMPVSMIESHYSMLFWSFKVEIYRYWLASLEGVTQKWFFDYWFDNFYLNYLGVSWYILAIFASQIVTLLMGIVTVFKTKKTIALAPIITCLIAAFLMVHVNILLSGHNLQIDFYQSGYLLTYLSLGMFITSFLLTSSKITR